LGDPLRKQHAFERAISSAALLLLSFAVMVRLSAAETIIMPSPDNRSSAQIGESSATGDGSVLERFRSHTGLRTEEALTALFLPSGDARVRQLPLISLSDGRTAVNITARIVPTAGRAVNFSLEGAVLLSVRSIKSDEWHIKALPDKGAVSMTLLVMNGTETSRYPLVAAPPLPAGTDLSRQGFLLFLEKSGDRGKKSTDLNGDDRNDYLDDYIFTANFLANQRATGRDRNARQQRALQRTLAVKPEAQKPEIDSDLFPD